MGLLDKLFNSARGKSKSEKKNSNSSVTQPRNENALKILECGGFLSSLLNEEKYIAKSDYLGKIMEYASVIEFFKVLADSGVLEEFCSKNWISEAQIQQIIDTYENIEKWIDDHNEAYIASALISEKEYLDSVLKAVDPNISLDDDQRRAILTDEDYCLVIAGAGAGKTTTVAAKVKYLV